MSSDITFSIEILKTKIGLLKFFETVLGAAVVGMLYTTSKPVEALHGFEAFHVCAVLSLFPTFVLLLSGLLSPASANTLAKSFFELLLHGILFLFYISSCMTALIQTLGSHIVEEAVITCVLGVLNSVLYFMSAFYSYKCFKD